MSFYLNKLMISPAISHLPSVIRVGPNCTLRKYPYPSHGGFLFVSPLMILLRISNGLPWGWVWIFAWPDIECFPFDRKTRKNFELKLRTTFFLCGKLWKFNITDNTRGVIHWTQLASGIPGRKTNETKPLVKKDQNFSIPIESWDCPFILKIPVRSNFSVPVRAIWKVSKFKLDFLVEWIALLLVKKRRASSVSFSINQSEQRCCFLTNHVQKQNQSWTSLTRVFPRLANAFGAGFPALALV